MEKRLFFLLDQAHHKLFSQLDRHVQRRVGVPLAQLTGVWVLKDGESITMAEFGKRLKLKNSAITGLVQRMKDNKLIEQKRSKSDGRSFVISLTTLGKEKGELGLPIVTELNTQLTQAFDESELDVVAKFLLKIMDIGEGLDS